RATVIGAGEYTIQASGVTSYLSDLSVLPVFGLKVVKAVVNNHHSLEQGLAAALGKFDQTQYGEGFAIALALQELPSYHLVRNIAEEVEALLKRSTNPSMPLYLVLDADIAKSLGGILKEELKLPGAVIALDGIDAGDLDYVDIGRPMGASESLPVTVKSLMFPSSAA
ncbi:MAG: ethanolamine ammonia-lyase reactivating factor EutA, partial [Chloroflexota bacterium]